MIPSRIVCPICNIQCDTELQLRNHEAGRKHRTKCLSLHQQNSSLGISGQGLTISAPKQTTPTNSTLDLALALSVGNTDVKTEQSTRSCCSSPMIRDSPPSIASTDVFCPVCSITLNSVEQYNQHLAGQKHLKKVKCITTPLRVPDLDSCSTPFQLVSSDNGNSPPLDSDTVTDLIDNLRKPLTDREHQSLRDELNVISPRYFVRSCRKFLSQIWPGVTFTQGESDTLIVASECEDDCVLRLDRGADSWFRVGIHLVTALLQGNRMINDSNPLCNRPQADNDRRVSNVWPTPTAVWITPKVVQGPDPSLFSYFRFPPSCQTSSSDLSLRVATTAKGTPLPDYDVLLTDPDYFVDNVTSVLRPNTVCCIVVQDGQTLGVHQRLCDVMRGYLCQFDHPARRARIICLSNARIPITSPFGKFREIYFTPTSSTVI